MTLAGGVSDKLGNRYEGRWTIFCMLDVMDEKADSISLEPLGIDGIEFFLRRKDKLEYHQVKRQRSGRGRWTLSALQDQQVQVLSDFWKSLSNPDVSCIFISTQDADELQRLAMDAKDAASWTEFEQNYLNKTLSGHFNTLLQKWGNCSQIDAYNALKRVYVYTIGEDLLVNILEDRIAVLVEGDPKTVRIELAELALNRIRNELTTHDIWHYLLEERGYRRREWGKDLHVLAAVDKVNERYLNRLHKEAQIASKVIPRDEVNSILDQLTSAEGKCGVLVAGEAGVGKSGVILQSVEALHKNGVPIIAFRVDSLNPTNSPDQVGEQLELPGSPAHVLANIAQGRDCVLIIDQLDAVSNASGRNPQFFECVEQIIEQTKTFPRMRLLLACRKFDLDYDYRLKRLTSEYGIA